MLTGNIVPSFSAVGTFLQTSVSLHLPHRRIYRPITTRMDPKMLFRCSKNMFSNFIYN